MKHWRVPILIGSAVAAFLLAAPALAALPPGRALEQVSPVQKNGGGAVITGSAGPAGEGFNSFASPGGDRVVYNSYGSYAGAPSGYLNQYLAERTAGGWLNEPLTPPQQIPNFPELSVGFHGFTCDTCGRAYGQFIWQPDPEDENEAEDIYTSDGDLSWTRESVGELPNPTGGQDPVASATGDVLGFDSSSPLTASATETLGGNMIGYIRSNGVTTPVAEKSDGQLLNTGGSFIGDPEGPLSRNAIGPNGSTVYFESPLSGGLRHVYVRLAGGQIRQVDASQCTGSCSPQSQDANWVGATPDGDTAYFLTDEQLLDEHPTTPGTKTLYSYKLSTGKLTAIANRPGQVGFSSFWGFQWASTDGSSVYFSSLEVLTAEPNAAGVTAVEGESNGYLLRYDAGHPEGKISFIGPGMSVDGVSGDGRYGLIVSASRLSPEYAGGTAQIYLFDAVAGATECLSCDGPLTKSNGGGNSYGERPFGPTDGGAVLFNTVQALDPQDTNEVSDVYLREGGIGGPDYLLSGGKSEFYSEPVGLSEDGTDAFFATYARLLKSDTDQYKDLYDARVGGGFPEPAVPGECEGEGCTGPIAAPPAPGAEASSTLVGPPDPKPLNHQKQKKKKRHKKKHQRHKKKHQQKKKSQKKQQHTKKKAKGVKRGPTK